MRLSWWSGRDRAALAAAVALPCAVCAALAAFRSSLPNTVAALVLVAMIVAVAANGHRIAGLVGAVSAAVWFDFFLTAPYDRLAITHRYDIETTVLLLVVGAAVTELAVRGRRAQVMAKTDARYLDAIESTTALIGRGASPRQLTDHVVAELTSLLTLRAGRFEANRFGGLPRLGADGRVWVGDHEWDLAQYGMPAHEFELLAEVRGRPWGRFVLEPVPGVIPALASRRCASVLAGQVAAALASYTRAA